MENKELGQGMPKICIPIVERTQEAIMSVAAELSHSEADLVEWRADYYEDLQSPDRLRETICRLGQALGEKELLFTIRTSDEGGEKQIAFADYASILLEVADLTEIHFVDVEMFSGMRSQSQQEWEQAGHHFLLWEDEDYEAYRPVKRLVHQLRSKVSVIGSYHDFAKTPSASEIKQRLILMQRMGADIPKIAVMPQKQEDVLTLMAATWESKKLLGSTPIITMSMGGMGLVSRVAGESFGSAVTFGCMGKPSAPGQIEAEKLRQVLMILHDARIKGR